LPSAVDRVLHHAGDPMKLGSFCAAIISGVTVAPIIVPAGAIAGAAIAGFAAIAGAVFVWACSRTGQQATNAPTANAVFTKSSVTG
jgi:hypothetical protein